MMWLRIFTFTKKLQTLKKGYVSQGYLYKENLLNHFTAKLSHQQLQIKFYNLVKQVITGWIHLE